jgi:hypothetical protein
MVQNQPYDYTAVNNAVRYGYQIFVGPGNYTKSMAYEPFQPLSRYIKEVIRIRRELMATIYRGEFLDTLGARIDGEADTGYCVFRHPQTGKRACVVVNYALAARKSSLAGFDGNPAGNIRIYAPFAATEDGKLPLTLDLPAERFAVVVEE